MLSFMYMAKKLIIIVVGLALIGAGIYFGKDLILGQFSKKAELKVEAQPEATVFLDGENVGKTPYQEKIDPKDYDLKIVPDDSNSTVTWQQTIKVNPGTQTYVNFSAGASEADSTWEIITLEKIKKGETEVTVSASADAAEVFLDGEKKGTTPLAFQNIDKGTHELKVTASGYFDNTIKINVTEGYKLAVNTHLAMSEEQKPEEQQPAEEENVQKVLIKDTPTGWLRVRAENSTSAEEVAKVNPGKEYKLVEEDNSWYKIEYEDGKEGWISGQYAEKVE